MEPTRIPRDAGRRPISSRLLALVLMSTLPVVIAASIVVVLVARHQLQSAQTSLVETTRALAIAVDFRVEEDIRRLEHMAAAAGLAPPRLQAFAQEATRRVAAGEFLEITLVDRAGRPLVSVPGAPAEATTLLEWEPVRTVLSTRRAVISDVLTFPLTGRKGVAIAVPVRDGDEIAAVLVASPDFTRQLLGLFRRQRLADMAGTIMDRQGVYIARTINPEESIGRPAGAAYRERALSAPEGIVRNVNPEGQTFYGTFVHTSFGWITALGMPAELMEAPYRRAVMTLGALLVASVALGVLAALLSGRSIAAALGRLAHAAADIGAGRMPSPRAESIVEVDVVRSALVEAGRFREAQRARDEERRRQLEAESRAKDEFLAMLGHELRNPLAAIANAAEVLKRTPLDEGARRARDVIERQARHQGRLLDDLLDVGRIVSGKITLASLDVDLAECARRALETLRAAGRLGEHEVAADLEPVWVRGDAVRLEQVVTNLLINAVKNTPARGRIAVATRTGAHGAVLQVEDSGVGIPAELLPRVFEVFVQGEHAAGAVDGLGLGLTIVRRIVELHGGTVQAESGGPQTGARFTVVLPRAGGAGTGAGGGESRPAAGRKVLVVEDNADGREMLTMLLSLDGHEVTTAATGAEALAVAAELRPEAAIVDIGLPDADGYSIARALRAFYGEGLRLIALTGYGSESDRRKAIQAGFDVFVVKPVDPRELARAVDPQASAAGGEPPAALRPAHDGR
jgi:signal transduction histidine kinase/ActR/RegA family two-component response regulator